MWEEINDKDLEKFYETSNGCPKWVILPQHQRVFSKKYLDYERRIQTLKAFEDDVWIATFPRSGTRWMQELVWCLRHGMGNDNEKELNQRIPFLEIDTLFPDHAGQFSVDRVESLKQPRTVKTHLSYDMLPHEVKEKAKIICVMRNPRDICASYLNHWRITIGYTGDLQTVVNIFTKDIHPWAPYSTHVLSYWNEAKKNSNLLIVTYEEMQTDLPNIVRRVAAFINAEISEEDIPKLCDHLHVDNMRKNPLVNKSVKQNQKKDYTGTLIHIGKTGNWKEKLDEEMIQQLKEWEEKWLKDTDLKFVYEL